MKRGDIIFEIILALSELTSRYQRLANDIRAAVADGRAHSTYEDLASHFDRQADLSDKLMHALIRDAARSLAEQQAATAPAITTKKHLTEIIFDGNRRFITNILLPNPPEGPRPAK